MKSQFPKGVIFQFPLTGEQIDDVLGEKYVFGNESGTVKEKGRFCKEAIQSMQANKTWKMEGSLKELCSKVWEFILKQNMDAE